MMWNLQDTGLKLLSPALYQLSFSFRFYISSKQHFTLSHCNHDDTRIIIFRDSNLMWWPKHRKTHTLPDPITANVAGEIARIGASNPS